MAFIILSHPNPSQKCVLLFFSKHRNTMSWVLEKSEFFVQKPQALSVKRAEMSRSISFRTLALMVAITEKLSLQSQDGRTHGMMYGYPWRGIQTYSNHPGFVTILVYVTHEKKNKFRWYPQQRQHFIFETWSTATEHNEQLSTMRIFLLEPLGGNMGVPWCLKFV